MNEAKHTPGPWRVTEKRGAGLQIVVDPVGVEVCTTGKRGPQDAARANASLIAAAPDMLAALEGFRLKPEAIVSSQGDTITLRLPISAIQAAAAAIAKAEA